MCLYLCMGVRVTLSVWQPDSTGSGVPCFLAWNPFDVSLALLNKLLRFNM